MTTNNEKVIAYIKKCLEEGRMPEAIDVAKISKIRLPFQELEDYIYKYFENGWISRAMKGAKSAQIELPKDFLIKYINKYLDAGRIYSAIEASKTFDIPLAKDKLVIIGRESLLKGNLTSGLEAYKFAEENPPIKELVICGNLCLIDGRLSHGLEAYKLANKSPTEEELIVCGNKCFNTGQTTHGLEAYELAKKAPTKEILRTCAEICHIGKNIEEARKAIIAAQKIEEIHEISTIEIREVTLKELGESKDVENSWKYLVPIACKDCENDREFKERFFILSKCPETREDEEWLDKIMKEKYMVEHYTVGIFRDNRGIIDAAECKGCGSHNVIFDV